MPVPCVGIRAARRKPAVPEITHTTVRKPPDAEWCQPYMRRNHRTPGESQGPWRITKPAAQAEHRQRSVATDMIAYVIDVTASWRLCRCPSRAAQARGPRNYAHNGQETARRRNGQPYMRRNHRTPGESQGPWRITNPAAQAALSAIGATDMIAHVIDGTASWRLCRYPSRAAQARGPRNYAHNRQETARRGMANRTCGVVTVHLANHRVRGESRNPRRKPHRQRSVATDMIAHVIDVTASWPLCRYPSRAAQARGPRNYAHNGQETARRGMANRRTAV